MHSARSSMEAEVRLLILSQDDSEELMSQYPEQVITIRTQPRPHLPDHLPIKFLPTGVFSRKSRLASIVTLYGVNWCSFLQFLCAIWQEDLILRNILASYNLDKDGQRLNDVYVEDENENDSVTLQASDSGEARVSETCLMGRVPGLFVTVADDLY